MNAVTTIQHHPRAAPGSPTPAPFSELAAGTLRMRIAAGWEGKLTPAQFVDALSEIAAIEREDDGKSGRGAVLFLELIPRVRAVIREYRRGGAVRHLIGRTFFTVPGTDAGRLRPFKELAILAHLAAHGVRVPKPIAALVVTAAGGFCYHGAIATEEITETRNLLDIIYDAAATIDAGALGHAIGQEAGAVIKAGVFHPDLHLGNVLCRADGGVFLIDFDKASLIRAGTSAAVVQRRIIDRWQRSLTRHATALGPACAALQAEFVRGLGEP